MNNFYTYIYLDPRKSGKYNYGEYEFDYEPFYVGKGKDKRWKEKKSKHCENKINKIKRLGFNPIIIKLKENIEEIKAFELEKELIELIGREILNEGPLTNETDGGEGISGYKHTEETLEKLRKEYCIIKNTFKKIKYELTTEEKDYKNNKQKLEYECPKGHKHSIKWNDFQQGKGCPYCAKKKIDFPDIKRAFEKGNCDLLTEEKDYKNVHQKLEYIHKKCGNKHSITWGSFQQGNGCPYCARKKIYFSEIKNTFEKIKYTLKTEEKNYINSHQKLEYKCPKGHEHSIKWNNFQQGKRCPYCYGNKIDFSDIKNGFKKINFTLLTEEKDYKNNKQKLEFFNEFGEIELSSWNYFQKKYKILL